MSNRKNGLVMKRIEFPDRKSWPEILKRPTAQIEEVEQTVSDIFKDVRSNGDRAIKRYTSKFDGANLDDLKVSYAEIIEACDKVSDELKNAIEIAKKNIEAFHKAQISSKLEVETMEGVVCWQEKKPIQKVGLYIPGGTAPLFSTILMLAIPAKIAGCSSIVLCTPPNDKGGIDSSILYAANICGINEIYKAGGIQAIAGLTFGTQSMPQVNKIFGPGNQFVTVAKQMATKYGVAIDMPAGPSELLIVADDSANPSFVASDLLSQAEHGVDSQVVLISKSRIILDLVSNEIENQIQELPRKDIAKKSIANSRMILMNSDQETLDLINDYGPEHFIICCENEKYYVDNIQNAGSVFIGDYTPESAGDYASGTNHTLPTNGFSKAYSGVNLDSFMKSMTFQKISEKGIQNIGPAIEIMAEAEGLRAHRNAVSLRLKSLEND